MQQLPTSGLGICVLVPPPQDLRVRRSMPLLIHFRPLGLPISAALHGCERARRVKRRRVLMQQPCHGPGDECPVHKILVVMLTKQNPAFSRKWMLILEFYHAWQWLPRIQKVIIRQLPHRSLEPKYARRAYFVRTPMYICACVSYRYFTIPTAPCGWKKGVCVTRRHWRIGRPYVFLYGSLPT